MFQTHRSRLNTIFIVNIGSPGSSTGPSISLSSQLLLCDPHPTDSRPHHGNLLLESGAGRLLWWFSRRQDAIS